MSYYNKPFLEKRKEEAIIQDNKCDYKLCLQSSCNDVNCNEHNCFNYASVDCGYGKYCEKHFLAIKTYYKSEVFKRI